MKGTLRELTPNTKEWLEWRFQGVGASDVPAVMGRSEYKITPLMLWEFKTRRKIQPVGNKIQALGHVVEDQIRALYSLDTGKRFRPALVEMEGYPYIRASLDGLCDDSPEEFEILEIKMVGADRFKTGELKESFKLQATQQMLVTGANKVTFLLAPTPNRAKGIKADKYHKIIFERDEELLKTIFVEVNKFWECVVKDTPPSYGDNDLVEVNDPILEKLLVHYGKLLAPVAKAQEKAKAMLKKVETEAKEIEQEIESLLQNKNTLCAGFEIKKGEKKGSVDYEKVPELKGVDLEQYRKKSTPTLSIKKA